MKIVELIKWLEKSYDRHGNGDVKLFNDDSLKHLKITGMSLTSTINPDSANLVDIEYLITGEETE